MQRTTYKLMVDQLQAIHRALTGSDAMVAEGTMPTGEIAAEEVARRFAEVDSTARQVRSVAERVPPFAFSPPIDVIDEERGLLVEAVVPGIDKDDLDIDFREGTLTLSGVRQGERAADGRTYLYAEIPRGPFRRVLRLPTVASGEPRVEVDRGIVRIWLTRRRTVSA